MENKVVIKTWSSKVLDKMSFHQTAIAQPRQEAKYNDIVRYYNKCVYIYVFHFFIVTICMYHFSQLEMLKGFECTLCQTHSNALRTADAVQGSSDEIPTGAEPMEMFGEVCIYIWTP